MSEHIRGSYDDALYKSTYTLLYFTLWRPEVARSWNFVRNYCFLEKDRYGKILKILLQKFWLQHRSTLCWNFVKFSPEETDSVIYLTKNKKVSPASQTVAIAWIAPKICYGQHPTMYSECSRLHPNQFTFGGVIAKHRQIANIGLKPSFKPNNYIQNYGKCCL